jgi:hypothetical protein
VTSAYAAIRILPGTASEVPRFKLLEVGFISPKETVRNLTDSPRTEKRDGVPALVAGLEQAVFKFSAKLDSILDKHKPDRLVCERFMARRVHTKATETVGIMNGILTYKATVERKMSVKLVPAAEWKVNVKKVLDLEAFYAEVADHGIPPHFVDAVSMPIYDACNSSGHPFAARSLQRMIREAIKVHTDAKQ